MEIKRGIITLLIYLYIFFSSVTHAMKTLCDLQLERLTELLNSAGQNGSRIVKNSPNDPVLYLDRLSAIFRHVTLQLGESSQILVLMSSENIFMLVYFYFRTGTISSGGWNRN